MTARKVTKVIGPSPIDIVEFVDDANLREVSWNQKFLDQTKVAHGLKHRQAVLFCNKAKDRFRLVACFYSMAVLILPPTRAEERLSLYLTVSQFLRKFKIGGEVGEHIENEIVHVQDRIGKRKKLAKTAQKKRRRRKAA